MADSLIDVREYPEYAAGHIQGAKLIPLGTLGEASAAWTKGERLTIVCKSGRRAEGASPTSPYCRAVWTHGAKPVNRSRRQSIVPGPWSGR
jgi:3-mercaptopyruvate sulfurtransferase SseA